MEPDAGRADSVACDAWVVGAPSLGCPDSPVLGASVLGCVELASTAFLSAGSLPLADPPGAAVAERCVFAGSFPADSGLAGWIAGIDLYLKKKLFLRIGGTNAIMDQPNISK